MSKRWDLLGRIAGGASGKRVQRAKRVTLQVEGLEDRVVPAVINESVFTPNFKTDPHYGAMVAIMNQSPSLVPVANEFLAHGGRIELDLRDHKSSMSYYNQQENTIHIDQDTIVDALNLRHTLSTVTLIVAHELGHTKQGGAENQNAAASPDAAVQISLHNEAVAVVTEYLTAYDLLQAGYTGTMLWSEDHNLSLKSSLDRIANGSVANLTPAQISQMLAEAGRHHALKTVSGTTLTYTEYAKDNWVFAHCGVSIAPTDAAGVDWTKVTTGAVTTTYDAQTGTWTASGSGIPLRNGATVKVSAGGTGGVGYCTAEKDIDNDGKADIVKQYDINNSRTTERVANPSAGISTTATYEGLDAFGTPIGYYITELVYRGTHIDGARLASTFGSQLGSLLGGNDPFKRIAFGSLGGAIGTNAANVLSAVADSLLGPASGGESNILKAVQGALDGVQKSTLAGLQSGSIFALSSLLVAEAAEKLGLHGFAGQVFTTAGNTVVTQLLTNINTYRGALNATNLFDKINNVDLIKGFGVNLGATLGAKLGSKLVDIDSVGESLFASVGSSYLSVTLGQGIAAGLSGTISGASASTLLGSLLLPGVGALIGAALGQVAGSAVYEFVDGITGGAFSRWFGEHPWHYRKVTFNPDTSRLEAPAWLDFSKDTNAKLRQGTYSLSGAYLETVNQIIASVGGRVDPASFPNPDSNAYFAYVNSDKSWGNDDYQVILDNGMTHINANGDPARIVRIAIEYELSRLNFLDGDPNKVRAFNAWKVSLADSPARSGDSLASLMSDLQLADDVTRYQQNTGVVNSLMAAAPASPFAVGWVATLLQWEAVIGQAAGTLVARSDGRFALGDRDGGIYLLNRSLEFDNDNPVVYGRLAAEYARKGDYAASVYAQLHVVQFDPAGVGGWVTLAALEKAAGNLRGATYAELRVAQLTPNDVGAWRAGGRLRRAERSRQRHHGRPPHRPTRPD